MLATHAVDAPQDFRLLLAEPVEIARRLVAGRVNQIAPVDRPPRNSIVVIPGNLFRRMGAVRQGNVKTTQVVPGLRDERPKRLAGLRFLNGAADGRGLQTA
ncbi:MAG: hypothetical protein ACREB3_16320 [Burkholderiales bacterium]